MTFPGGKAGAGTYQRIINLMPQHDAYYELFLGGGAVFRHKRPARINVGVEIDKDVLEKHWIGPPTPDYAGLHGARYAIFKQDALSYLSFGRWKDGELIYCDPPYLQSSRTGGKIYKHEMTEEQHAELLALLKKAVEQGAMVMISGYHSKLYARELRGWHLTTFGSMTRRGMALEHLWTSFAPPLELHDYRYLGDDYRERERIRKKVNRWKAKLANMPKLERQAILAALAEVPLLESPLDSANVDRDPTDEDGEARSNTAIHTGAVLHRQNRRTSAAPTTRLGGTVPEQLSTK